MFARSILALALAVLAGCDRSGAAEDRRSPPERPGGIALPGAIAGAWWDPRTASLYLTDSSHDTIVRWRGGTELATEVELPSATDFGGSARSGREAGAIGGLVRLDDGRFVIASFGFGEGAVYVAAGRELVRIDRLAPGRLRTAIALAPDGAIYSAHFEVADRQPPRGGVSRLDVAGGEVDVVTSGLRKPIGLAATASALYVTDAHAPGLLAFARSDGAPQPAIAVELAKPAVVTALPGGDAIVGTRDGVIARVSARGATEIARGYGELQALAVDAAGNRLFVVERGATPARDQLHVVPLSP